MRHRYTIPVEDRSHSHKRTSQLVAYTYNHTYIQVQDTCIPTNTLHNHIHIISQRIHTQHTHFPFPISPVGVHAVIRLHPSFSPIAHHPSSIVSPIPTASLALVMFASPVVIARLHDVIARLHDVIARLGLHRKDATPGDTRATPAPPNRWRPCHGPT